MASLVTLGRQLGAGEHRQPIDEIGCVDGAEEAKYVQRVLVAYAILRADSLGDLVNLRNEQRAWSGDPELNGSLVVWVERGDRQQLAVDQRSFEALGAPSRSLAV